MKNVGALEQRTTPFSELQSGELQSVIAETSCDLRSRISRKRRRRPTGRNPEKLDRLQNGEKRRRIGSFTRSFQDRRQAIRHRHRGVQDLAELARIRRGDGLFVMIAVMYTGATPLFRRTAIVVNMQGGQKNQGEQVNDQRSVNRQSFRRPAFSVTRKNHSAILHGRPRHVKRFFRVSATQDRRPCYDRGAPGR